MVGSEAEGSGAAGWEAARAAEATAVVEDSEAAMARVAMASVMVRAAPAKDVWRSYVSMDHGSKATSL